MCGLFSSMVSVCDSGVVMIVFSLFGHHSGTQSNQLSRSECNQCGEWGRYRCLCLVPVSAFVIILSSLISNAEGFKQNGCERVDGFQFSRKYISAM